MAYRSSSIGTAANNTTHTVAVPGSLADGDKVLIFFVEETTQTATSSIPSGFTLGSPAANTPADWRSMDDRVWWKDITSAAGEGSGGNYTFTFGSAAIGYLMAVAFSGRATGAPIIVATNDGAAGSSPLSIPLTGYTATAGDDVVWHGIVAPMADGDMFSMTSTFTSPASYTERQEYGTLWRISNLATRDNVSAGATGTLTGTATFTEVATSRYCGLVVAMAASGGSTPVILFTSQLL